MRARKTGGIFGAAALAGAIVFVVLYGVHILNPMYTDWLMYKGDLSQHYLGWRAFRNSTWTFPIGLTDQLSYPYYTSIMYTDSIPIVAIIVKAFSPLLPKTFQYFGMYGMLCFILNSILTAKIVKKYSDSRIIMVMSGVLINLSPAMLNRMFRHTALASIWLILLAFLSIIFYDEYFTNTRRAVVFWALLGGMIGGIHLYYLLFCGIILAGYCVLDILNTHKIGCSIKSVGSYLFATVSVVYLIGGFSGHLQASSEGLGHFSFNLLGLFNPMGWSCILGDLPLYTKDQYEGFSYLGAGVFTLLACTGFQLLHRKVKCKKEWKINKDKVIASVFIAILSVIAAASPIITFGPYKVVQLPTPQLIWKMWEVFRSSGRAIWVVVYMILFWAICADVKQIGMRVKIGIMSFCMILQIYDIHVILYEKHNRFAIRTRYETMLTSPIWNQIAESDILHIVLASQLDQNMLYSLADYALDHKMTLNDFYFARSKSDAVYEGRRAAKVNIEENRLYVFLPGDFDNEYAGFNIYEADGLILCYTGEL